jgi:hypothetical protein
MTAPGRVVVIGVGNEFRRDDGIGPAVVARLRDRAPATVELDRGAQGRKSWRKEPMAPARLAGNVID